jgi:hypothetical protein
MNSSADSRTTGTEDQSVGELAAQAFAQADHLTDTPEYTRLQGWSRPEGGMTAHSAGFGPTHIHAAGRRRTRGRWRGSLPRTAGPVTAGRAVREARGPLPSELMHAVETRRDFGSEDRGARRHTARHRAPAQGSRPRLTAPAGEPVAEGRADSQNSNRGEEWLSTLGSGVTDQMAFSSSAIAAVSLWISTRAELCIASATISTSVVVSRTAE